MPNLDGFTTCRAIRTTSRVPILMLTARGTVDDRVEGLDAGADDYLSKPVRRRPSSCSRAFRAIAGDAQRDRQHRLALRRPGASLPCGSGACFVTWRQIELTRIEFSLLELFLSHPHKVISRSAIFRQVWGYDIELASNSLEVYVGYLRRKTEEGGGSRLIQTVRGIGYVLREVAR